MATSKKAKVGTSKKRAPVKRKSSRAEASAAKKTTRAAAGRKSATQRKAAKARSAPAAGKPKKTAVKPRKKPAKAKATATTTRKPKPTAAAKAKPATAKPRKAKARKLTAADRAWQATMREALIHRRNALLSVVQSTRAEMAERAGDLADVSDRASEGFEDELAVGLMAIEASQLDDIDLAIKRISDGTYGICSDCEKAIPRKRLEVLPFARRCLTCESNRQRFGRAYPSAYRMGEDD